MTKTAVVIGAGPAGLFAASELQKSNIDVIIVEALDKPGGIARTVTWNGNRMDLGGHRYYSKNDTVLKWWNERLSDDFVATDRYSSIYYKNNMYDYPLNLSFDMAKKLGVYNGAQILLSYICSRVCKHSEDSLEDLYINKFGKKLYSMFFRDYTRKVWGRYPNQMSPEWGRQRVKGVSVIKILTDMLFHGTNKNTETSLIRSFYYPSLGSGQMWERTAEDVINNGGQIIYNSKVVSFEHTGNRISAVNVINRLTGETQSIRCDYVLSSMPLRNLAYGLKDIISEESLEIARKLRYRSLISVGVLIKRDDFRYIGNEQWIYIQDSSVKVGRIQFFQNWSENMTKNHSDYVWIGMEYFCDEGSRFWNMPKDKLVQTGINELKSLGFMKRNGGASGTCVKVPKAYPAYFGSYSSIEYLKDELDSITNLYCIGRNGQHHYNNMDHSMLTAYEAVRHINGEITDKREVWNVNTEETYMEKRL